MTDIYTAHISYSGENRLDITLSHAESCRLKNTHSPGGCLAPSPGLLSWGRLQLYRDGDNEVTRAAMFPEYKRRYIDEKRAEYRKNPRLFDHLLRQQTLVLVCVCQDPTTCHRSVAAEILARAAQDGRSVYHGEISCGAELLALTLHPEWSYAYGYLGKNCENRGWRDRRVVGRWIAIHGGKCIGGITHGEQTLRDDHIEKIAEMLRTARHARGIEVSVTPREVLNYGRGIVALAKVDKFLFGDSYGWYLGRPLVGWYTPQVITLSAPVPCRGAQGLWPVPAEQRLLIQDRLPAGAPDDLLRQLAA